MIEPPIPHDERARIASLHALDVLDTPPEERFDRITRLARRLFEVPIALVSLVDTDRQWFKSNTGLDARETPRSVSFCGHAILGDRILLIPDALQDPRFADNPLVTGPPHIRFYAGWPLRAPDGARVGTLCLIDCRPRQLDGADFGSMDDLARMVEQELATLALATTDPLTGLSNRRGFEMLARRALATATRGHHRVSLLYLDLDGFKRLNDEHGHAAGDAALVGLSHLLLETFRECDVVARMGGDEFCVLLTVASTAAPALVRLDERVAAWNAAGHGAPLRFSTGAVAWDPGEPISLEELLAEADRRMYAAKRARRARG